MTKEEYYEYLKSRQWQEKRTKRLLLDNFACQKCGEKKTNLQVHHITYENVGNEDIYSDLITLCKSCHEEIEKNKKQEVKKEKTVALIETENIKATDETIISQWAALEFCKENLQEDYSMGGSKNYCRIDTVKPELSEWLKRQGLDCCYSAIRIVVDFFSARRYEVIFRLLDCERLSVTAIERKMKFKRKMIDSVKNNRYLAIRRKREWDMQHENICLRHELLLSQKGDET